MDFLRRVFYSYIPQISQPIDEELHSETAIKVHQSTDSKDQASSQIPHKSSFSQRQSEAATQLIEIQPKFLKISSINAKQKNIAMHCVTLIGVIGLQKYYQQIFHKSTIVRIGLSQQINSLKALRKNSLDSLVICYTQENCQFDLKQIILAQQKLILAVQEQSLVKILIQHFENALWQLFQERSLIQCKNNLCVSITSYDQRYYIQFESANYFLESFKHELQKIKVQFQSINQYYSLMKIITLQDYVDFLQGKQAAITKIIYAKYQIQKQPQQSKRQTQLKIAQLLGQNAKQTEFAQPIRKESSIQADLEAEYFQKRISQKKTGQSQFPDQVYSSDLFYFIKERESVENNSSQGFQEARYKSPSINRINFQKRKYRSKSQHAVQDTKVLDLDDEFFTKY